jgi:hypothetical protein
VRGITFAAVAEKVWVEGGNWPRRAKSRSVTRLSLPPVVLRFHIPFPSIFYFDSILAIFVVITLVFSPWCLIPYISVVLLPFGSVTIGA